MIVRGDGRREPTEPPAGHRPPRCASRRRATLAAVIALGVLVSACSSSSVTTVGGCAIEPGAGCQGTYMKGANILRGNLFGANLSRADLRHAVLVGAILSGANLTDCLLYPSDAADE